MIRFRWLESLRYLLRYGSQDRIYLDLVLNFYQEESNYEKGIVIQKEFQSINDFIL